MQQLLPLYLSSGDKESSEDLELSSLLSTLFLLYFTIFCVSLSSIVWPNVSFGLVPTKISLLSLFIFLKQILLLTIKQCYY